VLAYYYVSDKVIIVLCSCMENNVVFFEFLCYLMFINVLFQWLFFTMCSLVCFVWLFSVELLTIGCIVFALFLFFSFSML